MPVAELDDHGSLARCQTGLFQAPLGFFYLPKRTVRLRHQVVDPAVSRLLLRRLPIRRQGLGPSALTGPNLADGDVSSGKRAIESDRFLEVLERTFLRLVSTLQQDKLAVVIAGQEIVGLQFDGAVDGWTKGLPVSDEIEQPCQVSIGFPIVGIYTLGYK